MTSSTASILTKETKTSLKQAKSTVNGTVFQTAAGSVADYVGGVISEQVNKKANHNTKSTTKSSLSGISTSEDKLLPLRLPDKKIKIYYNSH